MSIFGDFDVEDIKTNPYWAESGEYRAVLTEAAIVHNDRKGLDQIKLVYTITADGDGNETKFENVMVREFFDLHRVTKEEYEQLSSDEQERIRRVMAQIKRRFCGMERTNRIGLGVTAAELNSPDFDVKTVEGTNVILVVKNNGDDNQYTNVVMVEAIQ